MPIVWAESYRFMRAVKSRANRVPVGGVVVSLDDTRAGVANISRTGALLVVGYDLEIGREAVLTVNTDTGPASVPVRVVRSQRDRHASEGHPRFLVAVAFSDPSAAVGRVVQGLMQAPRWSGAA